MSERTHTRAGALHFRLILPVLLGEPSRQEVRGASEQVWPCVLQPNQGLDLDLWSLGRDALYNDGGLLRLTTPGMQGLLLRPILTQLLGQHLKEWRHQLLSADFWLDLPANGQVSLPIAHGMTERVERG